MLYKLRQLGMSTLVVDKAGGVGGTWYWNRYPGARCDIESLQYSYSFSPELEQEWQWSERYASQSEILEYANHVADRFELRTGIRLQTETQSLEFDAHENQWRATLINLETASSVQLKCRFCILATGCLSVPNTPTFNGIDEFHGDILHTGNWPHENVDFEGQQVAIIGTGSSAIQSLPVIAETAKHVYIFQRTPNYIVPSRNRPFEDGEQERMKAGYADIRILAKRARNGVAQEIVSDFAIDDSEQNRNARYDKRWQDGGLTFVGAYADLLLNAESNQTAADFIRRKIHDIVEDKNTAELLSPKSTFGCKRLCVDSHYYQSFNRDNVTLVDLSNQPISHFDSRGPTVGGINYEVDKVVLPTGFDAMTGAINKIAITGKSKIPLRQKWQYGPQSYLGILVSDFPNLFTITGPASPSVLSNVLTSIEFHVEWISDCLEYMQQNNLQYIEAQEDAEADWMKKLNAIVDKTLYRSCNSWYLGENIPGKPKSFIPYPGVPPYEKRCQQIADKGYPGFHFSS